LCFELFRDSSNLSKLTINSNSYNELKPSYLVN
jgi:hypothetical protein